MPRPERPLDPAEDALTAFAADLRVVREKAGSPTYRELARRTHYSSTTLADAAAGHRLPSLAVTLAYVRGCDGDVQDWERRWHASNAALADADPGRPAGADGEGGQRNPYLGLASFQPEDAEGFFGRERLTDELVSRVLATRFISVFGASGAGKSSLLRAGLISRLQRDGHPPTLLLTPGPHPLDQCAARLAAVTRGSAAALHADLVAHPRALHLAVLQALADRPESTDLVIVVDQFEEVFTLCASEAERTQFITALVTAARTAGGRSRVVLGARADCYVRCSAYPDLVEALRDAQLLVGPMTTDELRRAISSPAARVNCTVEGALLARVVADAAGQPHVLPLVSHALRETWWRRRGNTLALSGYEAAGGIAHALACTAEAVHAGLSIDHQRLVRQLFLRLVTLGEDGYPTRRRVDRAELDPEADALLAVLADARLVTLDRNTVGGDTIDGDTVELTHEALLRAWPRLREWIEDDQVALRVHHQLADAAAAWQRANRDPSLLYRGSRLAAARDWTERDTADLAPSRQVREFTAASIRHEQRGVARRRAAIALLAVLTLVASGTAALALRQRAAATAALAQAAATQTTIEAEGLRGTAPSLAAQLTLAAYHAGPDPETRTDLLGTETSPLSTQLAGHTGWVLAVSFSPSGRIMADGGQDGTLRLWHMTDPAHPVLAGPPIHTGHGFVYWLAFSPDGRTLAVADRDATVMLWNVTDPARPVPWGPPLIGHSGYVYSVSFSPNGQFLASASDDHTIRLWNVANPAHPFPVGHPLAATAVVASATWSPDGRTVVGVCHDGSIWLWNVTDPTHPLPWGPPRSYTTDPIYAAAFSPDATILVTVGADRTARLWNVTNPAQPVLLGAPLTSTDTIYAVAFSHDGHLLATGGSDHLIRLWNVTDPAHPIPLGAPLFGQNGYIWWLAFSPDDQTLASAGGDGTLGLWNIPRNMLTASRAAVKTVAVSPTAPVMATAGSDRTIRLWNLADPTHPTPLGAPLPGHTDTIRALAFRTDGRILASTGDDGTLRLWNLTQPARPTLLGPPLTVDPHGVTAVAFSPDGRTLATGGNNDTTRLWNITDPAQPTPIGVPLASTGTVTMVAFSPDGRTLASAGGDGDDSIRLWDVTDPATPTALARLTGHTGGVTTVAFSPDGRVLASGSSDDNVRLWNVTDVHHASPLGGPLTGHTFAVNAVAFSPDGHTLASGSDDGTVRLWNVTDPTAPTTMGALNGHTDAVNAVVFSPNGQVLVSGSDDRTVEVTVMTVTTAIHRICATTHNALTPAQWQHYIPQLPYTPPCP